MLIVTSSKTRQLLFMSFIQRVRPDELERGREDVKTLLADMSPGFRLLVDFSSLDAMDVACAPAIGRTMELIDRSGVGMVVRVIPDPRKDIGMNILSLLHYRRQTALVTCKDMAEAAIKLGLQVE